MRCTTYPARNRVHSSQVRLHAHVRLLTDLFANPSGNMAQIFGSESISFQHNIVRSFESSVLRLHGFFGVRGVQKNPGTQLIFYGQRPVLYVYDPKALHAVLIRDSDSFEQSERLIRQMSQHLHHYGLLTRQ